MKDFLCFRTMITPIVVQILFWWAVVASVALGIYHIVQMHYGYAIEIILLGPLAARILAELLLVVFGMHRSLLNLDRHFVGMDISDSKK